MRLATILIATLVSVLFAPRASAQESHGVVPPTGTAIDLVTHSWIEEFGSRFGSNRNFVLNAYFAAAPGASADGKIIQGDRLSKLQVIRKNLVEVSRMDCLARSFSDCGLSPHTDVLLAVTEPVQSADRAWKMGIRAIGYLRGDIVYGGLYEAILEHKGSGWAVSTIRQLSVY